MNDSIESTWLMLLHQLPPKPDYFRVRIRRRLQQLGAVGLRNAVYVLPRSETSLEDFQWLAEEIRRDGGEAMIASASFISGVDEEGLKAQFRAQSNEAYAELVELAGEARRDPAARGRVIASLEKRIVQAHALDYFGAEGRAAAEGALEELRRQETAESRVAAFADRPDGATWVTRQNVFIDRIASAWLIVRFIDAKARFRFVPATGFTPSGGELRFDMFEGEYGHEGKLCTFEVLLARFGLGADRSLEAIGQLVHDLDLRDDLYSRPEAAGLLALIQGIAARYPSDAERIEHGRRIFDQLYSHFTALDTSPK